MKRGLLLLLLAVGAQAQPVVEVVEVPTSAPVPAIPGLDPASPAGEAFAAGWDRYTDLRMPDAVMRWQEALAQADDPAAARDVRAWLAEAVRRDAQATQDSVLQVVAMDFARRVLVEDPCHAHAHVVLADALNPQFWDAMAPASDSTRHHLERAVACDPDDGNAWTALWAESVHRGDVGGQQQALRAQHRLGFWTPPVMAFARWTLAQAPPDAVLLTNGDSDTMPMRIAQVVDGLRPDVTVVNVPLLGLPGVARRLAEAEGLPLPDSVETFEPRVDVRGGTDTPAGRIYYLDDAVVDAWLAARDGGTLGRPIVAALTIDPLVLGSKTDVVDRGAHLVPAEAPGFDMGAARETFDGLDGAAFRGPLVHPGDRSAVRLAFPVDTGSLILFQMLQTAVSYAQALDPEAAEAVLAEAVAFAAAADRADDPLIATAREWVDADWGGE